jgi:histone H3/H4
MPSGMKIGDIGKLVSQKWKELSVEDKSQFESIYAEEKSRYSAYIAIHGVPKKSKTNANGGDPGDDAGLPLGSTVFPVTRVKRLIKLDSDVRVVSRDAVFLISKATELFLAALSTEIQGVAQLHRRRGIRGTDVNHAVHTSGRLRFLAADFSKEYPQPKSAAPGKRKASRQSPVSKGGPNKRMEPKIDTFFTK